MNSYESKILTLEAMKAERERLRAQDRTVVFTNGAFDILHIGHVEYLRFARSQGDVLIVGMNSTASVQRNKGPKRPLNSEQDRAIMLAALAAVNYVVVFDEDEPAPLVAELVPDVLVKGEDWAHYVSGRETVEAAGGRVVLAPMTQGRSTSGLIERIREAYGGED